MDGAARIFRGGRDVPACFPSPFPVPFSHLRMHRPREKGSGTMRIVFVSDIHGVPSTLAAALEQGEQLGFDRLVLLGDLIHGLDDGPCRYDPPKVVKILNGYRDKITAVRGNCDEDEDQRLFAFPMLRDYTVLDADGERFFLTHGHLWNEYCLPPIGMGTVLAHGHTHLAVLTKLACGITLFNPGSISRPKGGQERTFGYWDGHTLSHHSIDHA